MLSCLKGMVILFSAVVVMGCFGCGFPFAGKMSTAPIPPAHIQVEQLVIEQALADINIPDGNGLEVHFFVEGDGKASELVRFVAPKLLLGRGYRLVESDVSPAEIRLSVDTLRVTINHNGSNEDGDSIIRQAKAQLTAEIIQPEKNRQVYRGHGAYSDSVPKNMLSTLETSDPYVADITESSWILSALKPVMVGVIITVLSWMLYSYRG